MLKLKGSRREKFAVVVGPKGSEQAQLVDDEDVRPWRVEINWREQAVTVWCERGYFHPERGGFVPTGELPPVRLVGAAWVASAGQEDFRCSLRDVLRQVRQSGALEDVDPDAETPARVR